MRKMIRGRGVSLAAMLLVLPLLAPSLAAEEQVTDVRFDDLVPVEGARVQMAYIHPEADFSEFKRIALLEPFVAFRSNWQRDQNRQRVHKVSAKDMERIKADVAALFQQVFTERLAGGGYEVVNVSDHDVLLLRPAIVDLEVTAPDLATAGRSRTFSTSTGAATLYIELYDSVSGDILGRAADRKAIRNNSSRLSWSNSVSNSADARRLIGGWADRLVDFLDSHYQ